MTRYDLGNVARGIRNPRSAVRELNRLYHSRLFNRPYNTDGIDIFDADWDNIVILDACRYDYFERYVDLPGTLEQRTSRASTTSEFVRANFTGRQIDDCIYVTGNDHYFRLREEIGARMFGEVRVDGPDKHDMEELDITPVHDEVRKSDLLTHFATEYAREFPQKRIMVHYIAPHRPYRGPSAETFFDAGEPNKPIEAIRRGDTSIDDSTLRTFYREELDRVLPHVETLLEALPGKTVVSADHGELLGERCRPLPIKDYGHHARLYVDELVEIPWLVHQNGERKEIVAEEPTGELSDRPAEEDVNEQLRALGYKV